MGVISIMILGKQPTYLTFHVTETTGALCSWGKHIVRLCPAATASTGHGGRGDRSLGALENPVVVDVTEGLLFGRLDRHGGHIAHRHGRLQLTCRTEGAPIVMIQIAAGK